MRIPLGDFGYRVAQPQRMPQADQAAFDNGAGKALQLAGNTLATVAEDLYRKEAITESSIGIVSGERSLDDFLEDAKRRPYANDGTPRYESMLEEFDSHARDLLEQQTSSVRNPLARETIQKDLSGYTHSVRKQLSELATKQRADWLKAGMTDALETEIAAGNTGRINLLLRGMVETGVMDMEGALKERKRAEETIEYGRAFNDINSANTRERLFEIRGQLSTFNAKLSPEKNRSLFEMAQSRIDALDKENEAVIKADQDRITKELDGKYRDGTLTVQDVKRHESLLPEATFRRLMAQPSLTNAPTSPSGQSDEHWAQRMERDILRANRDGRQLGALRDRVSDLMTGYDPITRSYGPPVISKETGGRLLDDIEGYQRELRTEARQNTSDARMFRSDKEQAQGRDYREVEQLVDSSFRAYKDTRIGREAQADADRQHQKAKESLLKNRGRALEWWDGFKKERGDIFNPKPPIPSWVPQAGGKPDFEAAKRRLLDDKRAKRISDQQYLQKFDQLTKLERAHAAH